MFFNKNKNSIAIIGASGVGKTTVSKLLSKKLKYQNIEMDLYVEKFLQNLSTKEISDIKDKVIKITYEKYYKEIENIKNNLDENEKKEIFNRIFFIQNIIEQESLTLGMLRYFVNRINKKTIIDTSAQGLIYSDNKKLDYAKDMLKDFKKILLIPSKDEIENINLLSSRRIYSEDIYNMEYQITNEYFIRSKQYLDYGANIIYTNNKEPEQICEEIINLLHLIDRER